MYRVTSMILDMLSVATTIDMIYFKCNKDNKCKNLQIMY